MNNQVRIETLGSQKVVPEMGKAFAYGWKGWNVSWLQSVSQPWPEMSAISTSSLEEYILPLKLWLKSAEMFTPCLAK